MEHIGKGFLRRHRAHATPSRSPFSSRWHLGCDTSWQLGSFPGRKIMKKLISATLTMLLLTATAFAQTVDDHAKAKRGAIIGAIAGALAGDVISNNRNGHSGKRGAIVGTLAGGAAGA